MTDYPNVPGGCHCSVPALCAGASYVDRCRKLKAINADLLATLQTIADFAHGHGDVCEIITRRARAAIKAAKQE